MGELMREELMREEFERWLVTSKGYTRSSVEDLCPISGKYYSPYVRRMWEAWQASRENIEVELPKYKLYPDLESDIKFNILEDVKQKLTEQGFKVK